jgi:hypothetical protein
VEQPKTKAQQKGLPVEAARAYTIRPAMNLADERLSLQRRQTRLRARSSVLVNQLLGSSLIKSLGDQSELLVGSFLSRLFAQQRTETLEGGSQGAALLAIALTACISFAKRLFG